MARYTGKSVSLLIASTNQWKGEITKWELVSAPKDNPTFLEAETGVPQYTLSLDVLQDMAPGTAFRYLWDNAGTQLVQTRVAMYANTTATVSQPHLTFTITLPPTPTLGGEASQGVARYGSPVECIVDSTTTPPVTVVTS